ncbi:MAG: Cupin domain protein [Firmicutes bacterium ADurb.Bin300]|nr:MAG: Cupin domain protein [Firmicutes bacterium ADurb.Bin300]HOD02910.1 cupin domain-containing protein [Clostridiales bacterium]
MRSHRKAMYQGNTNEPVKDYGGEPFVTNLKNEALRNNNFLRALWTGKHLQVTLMSINPKGDIGVEVHPHVDQLQYIERGTGLVQMGNSPKNLTFQRRVSENSAILIPSGTWHNTINTGSTPLKLFSVYAPPEHPKGTVYKTKYDESSVNSQENVEAVNAPVGPENIENVNAPVGPDNQADNVQ